jgi:N utilization substance protein B
LVLQALFNLDSWFNFDFENLEQVLAIYQNIAEALHDLPHNESDNFSKDLFLGTLDNKEKIDEIISKATPDWGVEKTAIVDRNILRMAIFEMLFANSDVPPRVVINEAIELAKTFGHKRSYKFISGVLGAIYEVTGLKEKDDELGKNKPIVEKRKVGAMPYYFKDGEPQILMVHNIFNNWTLPKGTAPSNAEDIQDALSAVLKEKVNVEGKVGLAIGENEYKAGENKKEVTKKDIYYYLFEVANPNDVKLNKERKGLNNLK